MPTYPRQYTFEQYERVALLEGLVKHFERQIAQARQAGNPGRERRKQQERDVYQDRLDALKN